MSKNYEKAISDLLKDYGYEYLQESDLSDDFLEWASESGLINLKYVIAFYGGDDSGYVGYDDGYDANPVLDIEDAMAFDSRKDANKYISKVRDDWRSVTLEVEAYF